MEHERRRQPTFPACQPRLTIILGMASSTYRRISLYMAPAPIARSCAVTFRHIVRVERVVPDQLAAHETGAGGWFPLRAAARRAADLQLAPSTDHANSGNGTLQLSRDFPANDVGTNSRVLRHNVQANRTGKKSCTRTKWRE